jgi:hypothetical protein
MTLQNALGDIALDATLTDGTQKAQLVDAGGVAVDVSAANALKVDGSAVTQPVSGTVAVTGAVTTDALTDAELRAAAVPVSAAALPLPAGAATEATLTDAVGYLNTAATEVTLAAVEAQAGNIAVSTDNIDNTLANHTNYLDGIEGALLAAIDQTPYFEKMKVGTVSGRIAANFMGASMPQDGFTVTATGSGQSVGVDGALNGARYLKISSGTTINAVTTVESDEMVTLPVRLNCQVSASQRIANQAFYLELCGCDPVTGVIQEDATGPRNWIAIKWDGTTAANAIVMTRSGGGSVATAAAGAYGTTAATGTAPNFIPAFVYDLLAYAERVVISGYAVDALTAPGATTARVTALPNPLIPYKVRFRLVNGGSAPASTTDFRIHQLRCIDQNRFTAEITGGVGRAADQQSAVPVVGTVAATVSGSLTSAGNCVTSPAAPTTTTSAINSAATTNSNLIKGSAGTLYSITASNNGAAAAFLKLFNKATAPTVGTDTPVLIIPIPAGGVVTIPFGSQGYRFATGIALAITDLIADLDTTVIAAGQVKVLTSYI